MILLKYTNVHVANCILKKWVNFMKFLAHFYYTILLLVYKGLPLPMSTSMKVHLDKGLPQRRSASTKVRLNKGAPRQRSASTKVCLYEGPPHQGLWVISSEWRGRRKKVFWRLPQFSGVDVWQPRPGRRLGGVRRLHLGQVAPRPRVLLQRLWLGPHLPPNRRRRESQHVFQN